jgi:signal transduction histidine kinase
VFLVEDDQDFAALIEHGASKRHDWLLTGTASTLAEALEGIESKRPDVVLLDLGLPDSEGTATVDAIVQRFHPMAVVVLTGLDSGAAASEALRAGAQDFLDKSDASPAVLARTVHYARERAYYSATVAQQQRELADFASHAAHDLQAPLRSMSVFAELLEEDLGERLSSRERNSLQHIVSGAARMRTLVSDLIAYARSGHDDPFVTIDLQSMLGELHGDFAAELEEAGVVMDIGYLPPGHGQEAPVRQALRCLVGNAIKFRRSDGPIVRISGYCEADRTFVEVFDNGIGIPKNAIDRVVEPFSRVHGVTHYPGSGLGLALADRVVRRHEGTLRIESELGHGTTVRIDLPTAVQ